MNVSKSGILDWDSEFFGFQVFRLWSGDTGIYDSRYFNNSNVRLIYYYPETECDISIPLDFNSDFSSTSLYFYRQVQQLTVKEFPLENTFSWMGKNADRFFLDLAISCGRYSRFNLDQNIPDSMFRNLYEAWLLNSLCGKIADEVLVYKDGGEIYGFITISHKEDRVVIGLIGVNAKFQSQSIGSRLLNAAFYYCYENGFKGVEVCTQKDNVVATNFYLKNGFELASKRKIVHLWL